MTDSHYDPEPLERAATWLRRRAERAPAGPYGMTSKWTGPDTSISRVTRGPGGSEVVVEHRNRGGQPGVYQVDFFSYMTPEFAIAVAVWLEREAARLRVFLGQNPPPAGRRRITKATWAVPSQAHLVAFTYLQEKES